MQITGIREIDNIIYSYDNNGFWKSIYNQIIKDLDSKQEYIYDRFFNGKKFRFMVNWSSGMYYTNIEGENKQIFDKTKYKYLDNTFDYINNHLVPINIMISF